MNRCGAGERRPRLLAWVRRGAELVGIKGMLGSRNPLILQSATPGRATDCPRSRPGPCDAHSSWTCPLWQPDDGKSVLPARTDHAVIGYADSGRRGASLIGMTEPGELGGKGQRRGRSGQVRLSRSRQLQGTAGAGRGGGWSVLARRPSWRE